MRVFEIDTTNRTLARRFVNLPFEIYKGNAQWVPQLEDEAFKQMDRKKNPFYQVNDAAFFIAENDKRDVGRLCVMHPRYYNDFKNLQNAFFYLFESIDDQAVANALFEAGAA